MGVLKLENLEKRFGEKLLFTGLDFTFPDRGLYLILGGSGSGKTTLLRMIAGLDTDFSGSITGGGADAVTVAFQEHRLFPTLSALRNVSEPLRAAGLDRAAAEEGAAEALTSVGFPREDFRTRPAALSGGMRQRVSLARAFAVPRPILLLDEPEKELDEGLRERLAERILRDAAQRLVLLVTHTPERLRPFADGSLALSQIPEKALDKPRA